METTTPVTEPTPTQTTEPTTDAATPDNAASQDQGTTESQATTSAQTTEPQSTVSPEAAPESQTTEPAQETMAVPKPSEYVLPDGMPDDIRIFAHENGYTQEQLDGAIQKFGGYMTGMRTAEQTALRTMGEAHIKNWGENGEYNLSLAKRALKQNDPDGKLAQALNDSGYGNHPAVLDFLYTIGKSMQEGGFLKSAVRQPPGNKSAAQAMYGNSHPSKQ